MIPAHTIDRMYYVCLPVNTNVRAGDAIPPDFTVLEAPEADYYTTEAEAITAAEAYSKEHGPFIAGGPGVFLAIWWPPQG